MLLGKNTGISASPCRLKHTEFHAVRSAAATESRAGAQAWKAFASGDANRRNLPPPTGEDDFDRVAGVAEQLQSCRLLGRVPSRTRWRFCPWRAGRSWACSLREAVLRGGRPWSSEQCFVDRAGRISSTHSRRLRSALASSQCARRTAKRATDSRLMKKITRVPARGVCGACCRARTPRQTHAAISAEFAAGRYILPSTPDLRECGGGDPERANPPGHRAHQGVLFGAAAVLGSGSRRKTRTSAPDRPISPRGSSRSSSQDASMTALVDRRGQHRG